MQATLALFSRSVADYVRSAFTPITLVSLPIILLAVLVPFIEDVRYGAAVGAQWMQSVAFVNVIALSMIAYGYFLGSIAEERDAGALDLLRMSRLGAVSIILGKWGARLLSVLLLIAVQVPMVMFAVTLGGVRTVAVLGFFAGMIGWCVLLGGIGLLFSVTSRSATEAVTRGFMGVGGLALTLLFGSWWLAWNDYVRSAPPTYALPPFEQAFRWILSLLASLIPSPNMLATNRAEMLRELAVPSALRFAIGLGCAAYAAWLLPRMEFSERRVRVKTGAKQGKAGTRDRGRCPWDRPMFWKTFQYDAGGRVGLFTRWAIGICVAGWVLLRCFKNRGLSYDELPLSIFLITLLWSFELILHFSRAWSVEWKQQTLGALALTPQRISQLGKEKHTAWLLSRIPYLLVYFTIWGSLLWNHGFNGNDCAAFVAGTLAMAGQSVLLAGCLTYFTCRLRSGGTVAAIVIAFVQLVIASVMTMQCMFGAASTDTVLTVFAIMFTVPAACAGFAAFNATGKLLNERVSED